MPAPVLTFDQAAALQSRLLPGDCLLYKPVGLFGWLIKFHTGGPVAHCELYMGSGQSIASRDGVGVNHYPLRLADLLYVLRPTLSFHEDAAWDWFDRVGRGQKYGWADLLNFCGYAVNGPGMVCSPCVVYVLRAGGIPVFGNVAAERIAPNDLLLTELLADVTARVLGDAVMAGVGTGQGAPGPVPHPVTG